VSQRPAAPDEVCTCGRPARVVFLGGKFGDTGYCGRPDGGEREGPCPFCGGARHEGRCPRYRLSGLRRWRSLDAPSPHPTSARRPSRCPDDEVIDPDQF
jgi:hypothetical protein